MIPAERCLVGAELFEESVKIGETLIATLAHGYSHTTCILTYTILLIVAVNIPSASVYTGPNPGEDGW